MSRTKKKLRQFHKSNTSGSRRFITVIVVAILVVLGIGVSRSYTKNQAYIAQETELMIQLEEEQQRTLDIEEFKDYAETDEYIEQVAREKLGLAYEDEIIFQPME